MAWVRFVRQFDWVPRDRRTMVRYRAGGGPFKDGRYSVTAACARKAVSHDAAQPVDAPNREELKG